MVGGVGSWQQMAALSEHQYLLPSLQKGLVPCNYLEPVELRIHPQQQPQVRWCQSLTHPPPQPRTDLSTVVSTEGRLADPEPASCGTSCPEPNLG